MTFDATRYEREVLAPGLRRDSTPPADLLARYANPPLVPGPAFDSHVDEVRRHWRRLAHSQKYARLAAALLIADKQLREEVRRAAGDQDARLDGPRLKWLAQEQRRQAQAALVTEARSIAPAFACVSPATVEALVERSDGLVDPVEVGRILEEAGVRVVEPLPLPERPPTPKHREVERHLRALGLHLSPEAVFGQQVRAGFRALGGFRLTSVASRFDAVRIAEERKKLEMAARDERETVRSKLLHILEEVGRHQDHLDDLVLWELAELLRREPAVLSQRALAGAVVALGLDRAEADVLALSVIESRAPRGMAADVLEDVEEALLAGRLRGAERLAAGLPEDDDGRRLRERVSQVARTVSKLRETAERQLSRGGFEEAAGLLERALALAADDDDLRRALSAIPTPPPTDLHVRPDDGSVSLSWRPSAVRTGRVRYRVIRSLDRAARRVEDGQPVGDTDGDRLVDSDPPAGEVLHYAVFARRDGGAWSERAVGGPTVVTPEVREVRVVANTRSVSASWRVHPGAVEIQVERSDRGPPVAGQESSRIRSVNLLGFADDAVRTGVTYHYRIVAVYLAAGGDRHASAGVVTNVTPEAVLTAVSDLEVNALPLGDSVAIRAVWSPPEHGEAAVVVGDEAPPCPPGTVLERAAVAALGRELDGTLETLADGRVRLNVSAGQVRGRCYFTAVSLGRMHAVVGASVRLVLTEPVRDLRCERFGSAIRLGWRWPAEATAAQVRWRRAHDGSDGRADCLRRAYEVDGGFELAVGPDALTVAVSAVVQRVEGDAVAVPVELEVPGLPSSMRYRIRLQGWPRRRRTLVLEAERSCYIPELVLVQRAGAVLPLRPDQGTVVVRVPAQQVDHATPLEIPFEIESREPARLRLFASQERAGVMLHDPPVDQLTVP